MKKILLLFIIFNLSIGILSAGQIYAYPVPFNLKKGHSVIKLAANPAFGTISRINFKVFDINGDLVYSRIYLAPAGGISDVKWNTRNSRGQKVQFGMYIIRIEVEQDDGTYHKQTIRILIAG